MALLRRASEGWFACVAAAGALAKLDGEHVGDGALQPLVDALARRSEVQQALAASVRQRRITTASAGD